MKTNSRGQTVEGKQYSAYLVPGVHRVLEAAGVGQRVHGLSLGHHSGVQAVAGCVTGGVMDECSSVSAAGAGEVGVVLVRH